MSVPADASCSYSVGGFSCSCNAGFVGDGVTCTDLRECAGQGIGNNCHADATCTNTGGGFTCACNNGFSGDGVTSCSDDDECADGTHNRAAGATCSNSADGW